MGMSLSARYRAAFLGALLAVTPASARADPDDASDVAARACIELYERGQQLTNERPLDARTAFTACQDACNDHRLPIELAKLRARCTEKILALTVPSILVVPQRDGGDVPGARVLVAGVEHRAGVPIELNPGEQVVEVQLPGLATVRRVILVALTDDKRRVEVILPSAAPPIAQLPAFARVPNSDGAAGHEEGGSSTRTAGILVGSFGLASLGVGIGLGVHSQSKRTNAENLCPGGVCPDAETLARAGPINDEAQQFGTPATVACVVGGVASATGLALVLFSLNDAPTKPGAPATGLSLIPGGLSWHARF